MSLGSKKKTFADLDRKEKPFPQENREEIYILHSFSRDFSCNFSCRFVLQFFLHCATLG